MAPRLLTPQKIVNLSDDPIEADTGDLYFNTATVGYKYYDGAQWTEMQSGTGATSHGELSGLTAPNVHPASSIGTNISLFNGILSSANTDVQSALDRIDNGAVTIDTVQTVTAGKTFGGPLTVDHVDFLATPLYPSAPGRLSWNSGDSTLDLGLNNNVTIQIGQEQVVKSYNGSGHTILDGQAVYISGGQGQRPKVSLAQADSESTSSVTIGIATENISDGAEGFVATFGVVRGVDTSAYVEGSALWLSPTTPGGITMTKPVAPSHAVLLGYCVRSHATSGQIFVHVQNGYELDELHDVLITNKANRDIVSYNSSTGVWNNKPLIDAIKEVDGSGSGIDADTLDGQHSSNFIDTSSTGQTKTGSFSAASLATSSSISTNFSEAQSFSTLLDSVANTQIDSFNMTVYRSAQYFLQYTKGTQVINTAVLVIHNGTDVALTEYGTIKLVSDLQVAITADIQGAFVRLFATSAQATVGSPVEIKFTRNLIKV